MIKIQQETRLQILFYVNLYPRNPDQFLDGNSKATGIIYIQGTSQVILTNEIG